MFNGILLCLLLFFIVGGCIQKCKFFKFAYIPKRWIWTAFFIKLISSFLLTSIYTFHYKDRSRADIYKYYDDAVVLKKAHNGKPDLFLETFLPEKWQTQAFQKSLIQSLHWDVSDSFLVNDNRTLIRFNYVLLHLSGGFYLFHLLVFCILSFLGNIALFRFFQLASSLPPKVIFIIIFGIPSFIFWGSALLKESLLLFNLGFLLFFSQKIFVKKQTKYLPLFLLFILFSISVKTYVFLAIIFPLTYYLISQKNNLNFISRKIAYALLGVLFISLLLSYKDFFINSIRNKLIDFKSIAEQSNAGSQIYMPNFEDFNEAIQLIPMALYNVLIHPIFPPKWNLLSTIVAIEHLVLIGILFLPLIAFKKQPKQISFFIFCISFTLILSIIIGLSTPILGAIVRYKVALLPFYVIALITFVDLNKIPLLKKLNQNEPY